MLIKVSVLFVIGFAGTSFAASIDCNIDECRKPIKIYEELRCKPIYGAKSCCPKRFECADNVRKIDTNLCAFDDKTYKVGDVLRRNISNNSICLETCICSSSHDNEPAKFSCSKSNCDGISDTRVDDGCVKIYTDVKECCSTTTVCAENEKKNLATCWDNLVSYREGEKFISKSNPCYECLCHKEFDNTTITESLHCQKLNCDIELKYKSFVQRGCLPIFEDDKCCPIDWKCSDDGPIKKFTKRDVTESDDEIVEAFNESEENYSNESSEEVTDDFERSTIENNSLVTLNLDPFLTPTKETSMEEQTKSLDKIESNKENETFSTVTEELLNDAESSTISAIESSSTDEAFNGFGINVQRNEVTESTPGDLIFEKTERSFNLDETSEKYDAETPSENEAITEESNTKLEEEITTLPSLSENSKEDDASTTEQILSNEEKIPNLDLEAPKFEISTDLEVPFNSLDETFEDETTISPESSTFEISHEIQFTESSTENENFDIQATTIESEIETTTDNEKTLTTTMKAAVTQPTVNFSSHRKPKLIIKPSLHVIPPPPSPTEFEQLLTTLKQYVARLENTLAATKASEIDLPADFVNYTVTRSLYENEKEHEETKSISKRSVPIFDFVPRYFKHAKKEKGCQYGKRQYKLGETIRTDNECLDCLCLYSPIGHCTKKKECVA